MDRPRPRRGRSIRLRAVPGRSQGFVAGAYCEPSSSEPSSSEPWVSSACAWRWLPGVLGALAGQRSPGRSSFQGRITGQTAPRRAVDKHEDTGRCGKTITPKRIVAFCVHYAAIRPWFAPSIVGSYVGSGGAVVLSIGRERSSCVGSPAVGGGPGGGSRRVGAGLRWFAIAATAATLAACAQPGMVSDQSASPAGHRQATAGKKTSTQVASRRAPESKDSSYGLASFYSYDPHTASGEKFDKNELTAAHRTLPFGTRVRVTNVATGQSVTVRVNDRGPFVNGRVVDVSHGAADKLGITGQGVSKVKLEGVE